MAVSALRSRSSGVLPEELKRDADTDGGKHLASVQTKRGFELVEYALRDHCGIGRVPDVAEENREFVAAEAGDHGMPVFPSGADTRPQSRGNPHQQLIAGRVSQAVVDQLEAVQIDEQHREEAPVLARRVD